MPHTTLYAAPMEGLTTYLWRQAHRTIFGGVDKYFTPFLSPNANLCFQRKGLDEIQGEPDVYKRQIQDCVEKVLSEAGYADVAKAYILYRKQREKVRNVGSALLNYKDLVDNYLQINDWRVKENSTVTYSVGGLILSNSGAITANYWLSEIYDPEVDVYKRQV